MTTRRRPCARALLGLGLLLSAPAAAAVPQGSELWPGSSEAAPHPASDEHFGAVPDFEFVEADGRVITRVDLLGESWLAVPFFVKCSGP